MLQGLSRGLHVCVEAHCCGRDGEALGFPTRFHFRTGALGELVGVDCGFLGASQVDAFVQRCADLTDLCVAREQFAISSLGGEYPVFTGWWWVGWRHVYVLLKVPRPRMSPEV